MYYTYVHVVRLTYTESTSEIMCNKNKNIKTHQKPHNWLPLKEKINVIQDIENGCRPLDVADKYKITRSTVCFIKKRKETIMKCVNSGVECNSKQRKSTKGAHDQQLDEAVYKWFCQAKQLGQPISGPMICEKAVLFKKQISNNCDQDFKASSGWLTRFKKRHGIRERTQQGEKLSADFNGGIHYCFEFQNLLGENRFSLEFVFNADESGLNWKSLPDKTLACNYERDCPDLSPDYELPIESIENPMATNSEVCQIKSSENSTDNEISNFSQTYELQSKKEFFKTGSFSTCRKCRHKETLKDYAVKIIPKEYNSFYEELYLFKKCQSHPNVVKLIESFQEREKNYFVMELLTGGNLYDVVVTSFTEERSKKLLQQLASAVSFLHSKDVVHRDIKPENLVFVHSGEESPIKIIDFGFSLEEDECKPLKSPFFSLPYSAPEIVALEKYDERSDLWSLGSILYYMLTREQAFPITYSIDAALSIKSGKTKLSEEIIDHASDDCKDVIRRLLQVDPRKRLSATSLLSHSWFINENCDTIVDFQR